MPTQDTHRKDDNMRRTNEREAAKQFITDLLSNRYPLDRQINPPIEKALEEDTKIAPTYALYIKEFCETPKFEELQKAH